jgi:integrase
MKLSTVAATYVTHKQSMGIRFTTEARILKAFCRAMGDISIASVKADRTLAWLNEAAPTTRTRERKYGVVAGLYRYAIARGYANIAPLPLPRYVPRHQQSFTPYIYSHDELRRLLRSTSDACRERAIVEDYVLHTFVLLLYGGGLRLSEALSLTVGDVDIKQAILHIRETKFYKTRLVPIGKDLAEALAQYELKRYGSYSHEKSAPFLCYRNGNPFKKSAIENIFRHLCICANVIRTDGACYQPRMHDLRHSAAVHRLVAWYQNGSDIQILLPYLATWLGHVNLRSTQRYLTLTPELLQEASLRFEHYFIGSHHV